MIKIKKMFGCPACGGNLVIGEAKEVDGKRLALFKCRACSLSGYRTESFNPGGFPTRKKKG